MRPCAGTLEIQETHLPGDAARTDVDAVVSEGRGHALGDHDDELLALARDCGRGAAQQTALGEGRRRGAVDGVGLVALVAAVDGGQVVAVDEDLISARAEGGSPRLDEGLLRLVEVLGAA